MISGLVPSLVYFAGSVCISGGPALTQWSNRRGRSCLEVMGMVIFTVGGILWNAGALKMPPSLVAPLLASVLLMNVMFGKYVNDEQPTRNDLIGSLFISMYILLLVISQPGSSEFHCRFVTGECAEKLQRTDDVCSDYAYQFEWITQHTIYTATFLGYVLACLTAIAVLAGINWYIRHMKWKQSVQKTISDADVDNYRLSFSCIGGVFGGSEDIFFLFVKPLFGSLFAGCVAEFFGEWLMYVDMTMIVLWFIFQMWWVSRGVVVAGAKLNGTLELISHQFTTLFGIQVGLQGYKAFEKNYFRLHWAVAVTIFVLAIVCGVVGSAVIMAGFSVVDTGERFRFADDGSLHHPSFFSRRTARQTARAQQVELSSFEGGAAGAAGQ